MSKDFPKMGEGGAPAPAEHADRVGPVAANIEPSANTKAINAASPRDHAVSMKLVRSRDRVARVNNEPASFDEYSPQHLAAAELHGWAEHAHHEAKPIQLSKEDYEAALHAAYHPVTRVIGRDGKPTGGPIDSLDAANKGTATITDYEPHKPALSPYKGKGL